MKLQIVKSERILKSKFKQTFKKFYLLSFFLDQLIDYVKNRGLINKCNNSENFNKLEFKKKENLFFL
jgi:hypothetical protein